MLKSFLFISSLILTACSGGGHRGDNNYHPHTQEYWYGEYYNEERHHHDGERHHEGDHHRGGEHKGGERGHGGGGGKHH